MPQDLRTDFVQQRRRLLPSQPMTRSVVHVFLARFGIDGKQVIHQLHDAVAARPFGFSLTASMNFLRAWAPSTQHGRSSACRRARKRRSHRSARCLRIVEETAWALRVRAPAGSRRRRHRPEFRTARDRLDDSGRGHRSGCISASLPNARPISRGIVYLKVLQSRTTVRRSSSSAIVARLSPCIRLRSACRAKKCVRRGSSRAFC